MKLAHHSMTWEGWAHSSKTPFDFDAMLREIKSVGYEGVEIGGDETSLGKPRDVLQKFADNGLEIAAFGAGVTANPHPPNTSEYRRAMDYAAELDVKIIAVCGGFLPEQRRNTFEDEYKLFAENLAAACEYAAQHGQNLAFHPHRGCLVETIAEVQRVWKYLPNLDLCIDNAHLLTVRCDASDLVEIAPQRCKHVHIKDYTSSTRCFAEPGAGDCSFDFEKFLRTLKTHDYDDWIVVERDAPPIPARESAQISYDFLSPILARLEN